MALFTGCFELMDNVNLENRGKSLCKVSSLDGVILCINDLSVPFVRSDSDFVIE